MIVARSVWGARPASLPSTPMRLPATQVFIHHSVTAVTNDPYADMRAIEAVGLQRFGQFPYSFVVHPKDGLVLEGCGLLRGAHTARWNSTSFGVCWAGDYTTRAPKMQQVAATQQLIAHLAGDGHLLPGADVLGHMDVAATACPGRKLYDLLDLIRHPWEETMPDDPALPNLPDIKFFIPIVNAQTGECRGYYIVASDGQLHAFGPGAPFFGRSEVPSG
jgi:N-acetylmuramoyl-L-alanine amidase